MEAALPGRLQSWLQDEMRYTPEGKGRVPTVEELRRLCRGGVVPVWQFLLDRVRSEQTVKTLRANMLINERATQRNKVTQDVRSARTQRATQAAELERVRADATRIDAELAHLKRELAGAETARVQASQAVDLQEQRNALLRGHILHAQMESGVAGEFEARVVRTRTQLEDVVATQNEGARYFVANAPTTADAVSGLPVVIETASTKSVRELVEYVGEQLRVPQNDPTAEPMSEKALLNAIVQRIEALKMPPKQFVAALEHVARTQATALRDETERMDVAKEAAALRYRYEQSGPVSDLSPDPTPDRTVYSLLEAQRNEHISRFLRQESALNEAEDLNEEIERLSRNTGPDVDQTAVELVNIEAQLEGEEAALEFLTAFAAQMAEERVQREETHEVLAEKYERIRSYTAERAERQRYIQELVKRNMTARAHHQQTMRGSVEYVSHTVVPHVAAIRGTVAALVDSVCQELAQFNKLDFPLLGAVDVGGAVQSVSKLGVHRSDNPGPQLTPVLRDMQIPWYVSSGEALTRIAKTKQDLADSVAALQRSVRHIQTALSNELVQRLSSQAATDRVVTLNDAVRSRQEHKVVPQLDEALTMARRAGAECRDLRQRVEDWWAQPAQHTVPWLFTPSADARAK